MERPYASSNAMHAVLPEPDLFQLLSPEGVRVPSRDTPDTVSDEELSGLYRDMALTRRLDAEAIALQRQGELGLWASCLGQEAIQVGAGRALAAHDMVFPTYREHGVAWCRDVDPVQLLALFRGTTHGGLDPHTHNFTNYTIVIGAQTLHAAGYAMGVVRDGAVGTGDAARDTAVLVFFGDGASSQGDVHEAFVWASAENLPVVFICQNNQFAISAPTSVQSRVPLFHRAQGYGIPGLRVDGNDVLASTVAVRQALEAARSGQGPTLIEAFTYRMNPHTTNDDPRRYRLDSQVETWKLRDPLARVRAYLTRYAGVGTDFFGAIDAEADELGARIREGARALPDPTVETLFDHVTTTPSAERQRQRTEFEQALA